MHSRGSTSASANSSSSSSLLQLRCPSRPGTPTPFILTNDAPGWREAHFLCFLYFTDSKLRQSEISLKIPPAVCESGEWGTRCDAFNVLITPHPLFPGGAFLASLPACPSTLPVPWASQTSEMPPCWATLYYVSYPTEPPSAGPHVLHNHIPSTQQWLPRCLQHLAQVHLTPLPSFPTAPLHWESHAAVTGRYLQKVPSGSRGDTVPQGGCDKSCTEYSSQRRGGEAQRFQNRLDVCAGCSWNDNQVVGRRLHLLTAAVLLSFPRSMENGK